MKADQFKGKLKRLFEDCGYRPRIVATRRGMQYEVETEQATLKIDIGEKWVGYELEVLAANGKKVGSAVDTDNYPLTGRYEKMTQEIFEEVLLCLRSLAAGEIYVGMDAAGKLLLVIPVDKNRVKIIRKGR